MSERQTSPALEACASAQGASVGTVLTNENCERGNWNAFGKEKKAVNAIESHRAPHASGVSKLEVWIFAYETIEKVCQIPCESLRCHRDRRENEF